jgi:signal transduction histidine kinase
MFSLPATLLITTIVVNLCLIPFIYPRRGTGMVNGSFALAVFAIAVWAGLLIGFLYGQTDRLALDALNLSYVAAAVIAAAFYYFSIVFPSEQRPERWHTAGLIAVTTALSAAILLPGFLTGVLTTGPAGRTVALHLPGYLLFVAVFCSLFAAVLARIWRKFFAATGVLRTQLFIIGINVTVVGLLGVYFDLILPSPFLEDFRYVWTGPVFTDIFAAATAYSIFRYRLFNTKAMLAEFLVFAIWILLLVRILTSDGVSDLLGNAAVLALAVPIGLLLIHSLDLEVQAREAVVSANAKLTELDRLKSEFLSLAAHQLRGPVTIIRGYLAGIGEGDYGLVPQALKLPIARASETAQGFAALIDDYLNVARIEQGKMAYTFVLADFADLVRRVAEEYAPIAEKKGLGFSCTVDPAGSYQARLDAEKMNQVVSNLIDNAIKYTTIGEIAVGLAHDPALGRMRLTVSDTGAGSDPAVLPTLFQKFTRADAKGVNPGGSGLGLYVARQFVEAHGGRIWAESAGQGRGTTFIVELPVPSLTRLKVHTLTAA